MYIKTKNPNLKLFTIKGNIRKKYYKILTPTTNFKMENKKRKLDTTEVKN